MANINQRTVYRTAKGTEIDLNKLINQNELTIAVGNKKVNARGDLLGPGGQIIKKHEDIMADQLVPDKNRGNTPPIPQEVAIVEEAVEKPELVKSKNVKPTDNKGNQ